MPATWLRISLPVTLFLSNPLLLRRSCLCVYTRCRAARFSASLSAHNCVCRLTLIFLCEHYLPCLSSPHPSSTLPESRRAEAPVRVALFFFFSLPSLDQFPLPPTLRAKQSVSREQSCAEREPRPSGRDVDKPGRAADVGLGLRRPPRRLP